jgi:tetratricopeptide (TPR) repeat protein
LVAYVLYLYKMIWPVDLAIFYPFPDSIPIWQPIGAIIILIVVTGFALLRSKSKPYLIIGWLWFLGVLFPVIGLIQGGLWPALANRWAYVPFIGIFIIFAWGIPELLSKWHYRKTVLSVSAACVMIILFWGTRTQLGYWTDTNTLFNRALAVTENNFLAYGLVGSELAKKGEYKTAEKYLLTALRIRPDDTNAMTGLGQVAYQTKENNKALAYYQKSLLFRPSNAKIMCIICDLLIKTGKLDKAVDYYSDALVLKPSEPEIYNKLGTVFFSKHMLEQAREKFETAVRLDPRFDEAYYNLGLVALKQGEINNALNNYKKAISINPDYGNAHKSLADLLFSQGDLVHAIEHYSEALRINPDDATTHFNIGVILFQQQQIKAADEHFSKAVQIDTTYEKAKIALAMTKNILGSEKR